MNKVQKAVLTTAMALSSVSAMAKHGHKEVQQPVIPPTLDTMDIVNDRYTNLEAAVNFMKKRGDSTAYDIAMNSPFSGDPGITAAEWVKETGAKKSFKPYTLTTPAGQKFIVFGITDQNHHTFIAAGAGAPVQTGDLVRLKGSLDPQAMNDAIYADQVAKKKVEEVRKHDQARNGQ